MPAYLWHQHDCHSDCMAVVRTCRKSYKLQLRHSAKYSGCRRFALLQPGAELTRSFSHVPAHRSLEIIAALPETDRTVALGNHAADANAKRAVFEHHPQPPESLKKDVDLRIEQAKLVLRTIGAVLVLFEPEKWPRLPRPPFDEAQAAEKALQSATVRAAAAADKLCHDWVQQAWRDGWYCTKCLKLWPSGEQGPIDAVCSSTAISAGMQAVMKNQLGHRLQLMYFEASPRLGGTIPARRAEVAIVCITCGSYATSKPVNLLLNCEGPAAPFTHGRAVPERARRGEHSAWSGLKQQWASPMAAVVGFSPGQDGPARASLSKAGRR